MAPLSVAGAAHGKSGSGWSVRRLSHTCRKPGSRQSVNRLLADLTDQGLVRLERDHLVVVDIERLARTVER